MSIEFRDRMHAKYGTPEREVALQTPVQEATPEAFVLSAESGRTIITTPLREIAQINDGFMYLKGRFVEADTPNSNGALWTTDDLQMGAPTVAGGPLNWLHQETKIVGALLDGALVAGEREAASDFTAADRRKDAKSGAALPDGSFPIVDRKSLEAAIHLVGRGSDPAAAKAHIIARAKALGLLDALPTAWRGLSGRQAAAWDAPVGNHIVSNAVMWKFLFPDETRAVEHAAATNGLYLSMECLSREVACMGDHGCGASFSYEDYNSKRTCAHLREKSSIRRFVDPQFLGAALIVPPVRPGWANANVEIQGVGQSRIAAQLVEEKGLASDVLDRNSAEGMVAQLLAWANR